MRWLSYPENHNKHRVQTPLNPMKPPFSYGFPMVFPRFASETSGSWLSYGRFESEGRTAPEVARVLRVPSENSEAEVVSN